MSVRLKVSGLLLIGAASALCGCGGGSSSSSLAGTSSGASGSSGGSATNNTLAIAVDGGPGSIVQADGTINNTAFASVTICAPGSSTNCQTIDHLLIDTESVGLRVMGSLLNAALAAALVQSSTSSGQPAFECAPFADGYSWGPLSTVDIQFTSAEKARSVPVHIIEDPTSVNIPAVPQDCQQAAGEDIALNTPDTLAANGVLGLGGLLQDCGVTCVSGTIPGTYYACTTATSSGVCTDSTMSLTSQVQNPAALIAGTDNNGVALTLPAVSAPGAVSVSGTLYFGVGTQSNNGLGAATVFQLDSLYGQFVDTQYAGTDLPDSVLDYGSSTYAFNGNIPQCTSSELSGFYCPSSTLALSATIQGQSSIDTRTGTQVSVSFDIGNAANLFATSTSLAALPTLGSTGSTGSFDWGLPFFYGKTLFVVFETKTAKGQSLVGPYMAF